MQDSAALLASLGVVGALNAVQERCLAVLVGDRAGDELRAAASTMLKNGGLTSQEARRALAVAKPSNSEHGHNNKQLPQQRRRRQQQQPQQQLPPPAAAAQQQQEEIPQQIQQQPPALDTDSMPTHCQPPGGDAPANAAQGWGCSACTLTNRAGASRCKACGQAREGPKAKRARTAAAAAAASCPFGFASDYEDADAFA